MGMFLIQLFSFFYRVIRQRALHYFRRQLERKGQPVHIEDAIDFGDRALVLMDKWVGFFLFVFQVSPKLRVNLYDLSFPSPLISASFKSEMPILNIWLKLGLGAVTVKTIMAEKRSGNAKPRIQEVTVDGQLALVNAMGLPGPGVDGLLSEFSRSQLMKWDRPIGFSIGGNTLDEYCAVFERLESALNTMPNVTSFFEFNISCPNVPGEKNFDLTTSFVSDLLIRVRSSSQAVVGIKLSPDFSDESILAIVAVVKQHVRTYVNLGNTQFRKCEELGLAEDAITIGGGGLSGSPLYDRTLAMTRLVASTGVPIIATGGVSSAKQVNELLENGATLVGMATAIVQDQYVIPRINYELASSLDI